MKSFLLMSTTLFSFSFLFAQNNVGVGTTTPLEKLDVNGNVRADNIIINNGGSTYDFLMKNNNNGQVGFKKGHGGLGVHYIIATDGVYPAPGVQRYYDVTIMGEIKLFAGFFAPEGWVFCEGQLLSIVQHQSLFYLLGTVYGGNGVTTFALPDLRGAVPVGPGTSVAGYNWQRGTATQ